MEFECADTDTLLNICSSSVVKLELWDTSMSAYTMVACLGFETDAPLQTGCRIS